MNLSVSKSLYLLVFFFSFFIVSEAQVISKQKGLLWEITGNGLKKPSYVYGTMHISSKLAFHLGDSFYYALVKSDVVALEQNLDSVIHKWITDDGDGSSENGNEVEMRNIKAFLTLDNFRLSVYDKELVKRKLSAQVREVNYLLKRGNEDDFEEDAWLDLYIYQIGKRLGKGITGVEGYEESKALVEKSKKEPETKKKLKRYDYKMRDQVAEAYSKGNIYMIDSIDRMTESDHYREYMLYKRNENMVRRMDSIVQTGKTLFTGVGCAHLPGKRGVLQILIDIGYSVRPVQSLANEKSKLAEKYENMTYKHRYALVETDDHLIAANLPARLTKVRNTSSYASYLCPDLANGYYYQIEKITCNTAFSGKKQEDILLEIDTMIFENIPGDVKSKKYIVTNGFPGIEVVTELKTGDLNRFQIVTSPFNVYIIRMAGKKKFAVSSVVDKFFKTLLINESNATSWQTVTSGDSVFSLQLPSSEKNSKLAQISKVDPSFEHIIFDRNSGNTYLIKQEDILNLEYIEEDTFELGVMARSFSLTNNYSAKLHHQFSWQGYYALDVIYEGEKMEKLYARFVICGTRYIQFLLKPKNEELAFEDKFFTSIKFNKKPFYKFFKYTDTSMYFSVSTPHKPLKANLKYNNGEIDEAYVSTKYEGKYTQLYFKSENANELITVAGYRNAYYERQAKSDTIYFNEWLKKSTLKVLYKYKVRRDSIDYFTFEFTDTNSNKRIRMMSAQKGPMRYYVSAFIDTIAGSSDFITTFFNTFSIADTTIPVNNFEKKGRLFFEDFAGKDSLARAMSLKYFDNVVFFKEDITDLKNCIDSITSKSNAIKIKIAMIAALGMIDSADALIVPYLSKRYFNVGDTSYLQMEILRALANQKSEISFKSIKPILVADIPISDNIYEMEDLLNVLGDSIQLTKILLTELMELTTINEYRNTAYDLLSKMKDSNIIVTADYASIHNRLVTESRIAYKRKMSAITNTENGNNNNYNHSQNSSEIISLLNLSLPLRNSNPQMKILTDKILEITDNETRLELLPVLLRNKIDFNDSVYESLAKSDKTTLKFYNILKKADQLNKFPTKYKTQKQFILADIRNLGSEDYLIDSIVCIEVKKLSFVNKNYLMYIYKYHTEYSNQWEFYTSDLMPLDTFTIFDEKDPFPFYGQSAILSEGETQEKLISDLLFETFLKYVRERNGGFYEGNYNRQSVNYNYNDGY